MREIFIGKNIKFLRDQTNTTQEKLAKEAKINRSTLSKWESNFAVPDVYEIARIMKYFDKENEDIIYTDLEKKYKENQKLLSLKTFLIENGFANYDDEITQKDYTYIASYIYNTFSLMKEEEKKEEK